MKKKLDIETTMTAKCIKYLNKDHSINDPIYIYFFLYIYIYIYLNKKKSLMDYFIINIC